MLISVTQTNVDYISLSLKEQKNVTVIERNHKYICLNKNIIHHNFNCGLPYNQFIFIKTPFFCNFNNKNKRTKDFWPRCKKGNIETG